MSAKKTEPAANQKAEQEEERKANPDDFEVVTHEGQTARRCRKCKTVLPATQHARAHECTETSKSPNERHGPQSRTAH